MILGINCIVPATLKPVTLDEVKRFCRIDDTNEDDSINELIDSAIDYYEGFTRTTIMEKQWEVYYSELKGQMYMPRPILNSVNGIYIRHYDNSEAEIDSSNYSVFTGKSGFINFNNMIFVHYSQLHAAPYRIVINCGYTSINDVPNDIKTLIKRIILEQYETNSISDKLKSDLNAKKVYLT